MNLANNKNLKQDNAPINFIASTQSKKHITIIILTMKMGQAFNAFKTKPQGFFCWSSLLCTKHDHCTCCLYLTFVSKFPLACKWKDVGIENHNWTWSKESAHLQFSSWHSPKTLICFKHVEFETLPLASWECFIWQLFAMSKFQQGFEVHLLMRELKAQRLHMQNS